MMKKILAASLLALAGFCGQVQAADAPYMPMKMWFVKVGASYVVTDSAGNLPTGFGSAPITVGNAVTGTVEIGRFVTDNLSVSFTGGIPPAHKLYSFGVDTGSTATVGAMALTGQFHLINNDTFDAYVGAGIGYNIYFSDTSPIIDSINNGFAPVLQAGLEYKASDTIGIFTDVKKEFYSATVNTPAGSFSERLDPWVFTAGVALHF